ncbi:MAG: transcription antitermination factor NusB [Betaproteobacteria bacterium]|nr:transcription antitermination factor NusB [Betaproteobacteria bacterium]
MSAQRAEGSVSAPAPKKGRGSRQLSRELVLRALYQWQVGGSDLAALIVSMEEEEDYAEVNVGFFRELLTGVLANAADLDAALAPHLDRAVKELSPIEHGCLLIGAQELAYTLNVPYKVAINESVNLAKKYGGTDGHKFVNGVLDKLAKVTRVAELTAR